MCIRDSHVLGHAADAADTATLIAAVQSKTASASLYGKFPFGAILEAPPVDPALLVAAMASVDAADITLCGGFCQLFDDNDNQVEKVSIARAVAGRLARNPISVSSSRRADDGAPEPLSRVRAIFPTGSAADGSSGFFDSFYLPTLNNARFTTLATRPGEAGFFVANPFMLTATNSNYFELENKRIIQRAREVLYYGGRRHLQRKLRRDATTGFISEATASDIETDLTALLKAALVAEGHADWVVVTVSRQDNLVADPTLRIAARLGVPVRARTIEMTVGTAVAL